MLGVNLGGFFWLTQRAVTEMMTRGSGHVVSITTTLADYANLMADRVHRRGAHRGATVSCISARPTGAWTSS
jgi:NAD(P)-dependent dehydrogenase (short-subunit alcohol dehydrogenase family)